MSTRPLSLPLRTDRLVLRAYRLGDVEPSWAYYGNPEVARYIPWEAWTLEETRDRVRRRMTRTDIDDAESVLSLAVTREGELIGDVVLWPTDDSLSRGEIGWAFHPGASGQGYATEAVRAVLGLAFDHYGMHKVVAQLDARNTASARLCERVGMRHEGTLRRDRFAKGEWFDLQVFGLLAGEWAGVTARDAQSSEHLTGRSQARSPRA